MQLGYHFNSYNLMHNQESRIKDKIRIKQTQELWLDAPGLALVLLIVSALDWCWLWWFHASWLHVIYRKYASMSY
jgi:hypothetical protein